MQTNHVKVVVSVTAAIALLAGCGEPGKPPAQPVEPATNASAAAPTATNPVNAQSEAAHAANQDMKTVFLAFCKHLNSTLEATSRLDLASAQDVVYGSFKPVDGAPPMSPELMAAIMGEYGNKPGTFQVMTVGGQKRTFEFKPGNIIEEQGNGYLKWTFLTTGNSQTFGGGSPER